MLEQLNKVTDLSSNLPEQIIQTAQDQQQKYHQVKSEIDAQMSIIHERLQNVCNFISDNTKTIESPEKVLIQGKQLYLECLRLRNVELLQELLKKDEVHWTTYQENAKKQAAEIGAKISDLVERQKRDLANLLNTSLGNTLFHKP